MSMSDSTILNSIVSDPNKNMSSATGKISIRQKKTRMREKVTTKEHVEVYGVAGTLQS